MNKTYSLTLIALGAALVAALSPFQIPLGPIPITLQTLAIGLVATIYRPKEATLAIVLYLLLGAIGLPVFAGGKGGFQAFFGPTAGFLVFFPIRAFVTSIIATGKTKCCSFIYSESFRRSCPIYWWSDWIYTNYAC